MVMQKSQGFDAQSERVNRHDQRKEKTPADTHRLAT